MPRKPAFEVGTKYGMLTIIGKSSVRICDTIAYDVLCDCGKTVSLVSNRIKSGPTASCGCRGKNLVGQKFGNLIVLERTDKRSKDDKVIYICECDCGNKIERPGGYLTSGDTTSCGCVRTKILNDWNLCISKNPDGTPKRNIKWVGHEDISGTYFASLKSGAKARGIEFDVTIENLWDLFLKQNNKCAISGLYIYAVNNHNSDKQTASVDRIDSKLGYVKDNIQWVHKDINWMKNDHDQEYFINTCKMIAKYQGEKNVK